MGWNTKWEMIFGEVSMNMEFNTGEKVLGRHVSHLVER